MYSCDFIDIFTTTVYMYNNQVINQVISTLVKIYCILLSYSPYTVSYMYYITIVCCTRRLRFRGEDGGADKVSFIFIIMIVFRIVVYNYY